MGGRLTLACHILTVGTVTLPFRKVMLSASPLVALGSLLWLVDSPKGDSPSLRWDLGMYLKIGGIDPVEATSCLVTWSTRGVALLCSLASFLGCYLGASSLVVREAFFATPLPMEEIVDGMVSLGIVPSSKNLASAK